MTDLPGLKVLWRETPPWTDIPLDRDTLDRDPMDRLPLDRDPRTDPLTETSWTEIPQTDPTEQRPLWRENPTWTEILLDRDPGQRPSWTVTPSPGHNPQTETPCTVTPSI